MPSIPEAPGPLFSVCVRNDEISLTMNVRGMNRFSAHGLRLPRIYTYIRPTNGLQHRASIDGGVFQGGIAVDGTDTQQIQGWVMYGQKYCKCILEDL